MRSLRAWLLRLAALFDKERRDRELADEMEAHLLLHIEENMRGGMSPEEARREAKIKRVWLLFGNEKSREKSGDFGRCRRGDGRKLPGYRGEGGISPGLALPFLVFPAGSRWRWAFCETPCIC